MRGAKLKLKRADKHIADFERTVRSFKKSGICVIGTKKYPGQTNFDAVYIKSVKKVPAGLPIIAGDALFNLRSALDHAVMELWIAAGNSRDDRTIQFPVFSKPRTASEYSAKLTGQIQSLGCLAIKAIKAIEPYQGGAGNGLWVLNELNNTDKHRLLLTVATGMRPLDHGAIATRHHQRRNLAKAAKFPSYFIDTRGNDPPGKVAFKEPNILYGIRRGDIIYGIPKGSDLHKDLRPTFEIAFDEPQVGQGDTAVKTLADLSQLVAYVIDQLGRLI